MLRARYRPVANRRMGFNAISTYMRCYTLHLFNYHR